MLEKGWIRPSISPYGAALLVFCKKTGKLWMYIDYYALKHQTKLNIFLISCIADLLNHLGCAHIFLLVDLVTAYQQIHVKQGHEYCIVFFMPQGLY